MKAYLIISYMYYDYSYVLDQIHAVCTTKQLADQYVKKLIRSEQKAYSMCKDEGYEQSDYNPNWWVTPDRERGIAIEVKDLIDEATK